MPVDSELDLAALVLNRGKRVVILAGAGALGARPELLQVAEVLASPIAKTLSGKAAAPDNHPLVVGGIGLLGTEPTQQAMESCDTLLMIGTNFPFTKYLPEPGSTQVVQIERDAARVGNRMPTAVPLVGEAAPVLRSLLPRLTRKTDRAFLATAQASMTAWREKMASLEDPQRDPIQPQYLMRLIDRHATDDAILCCDSGTIATWAARHFDIRGDRFFMLSGNLASMSPGLPYAIGAQSAHPGRQCVAFVGDGGFAMLMGEFLTAAEHRLPIKVFINNNGALAQIMWEQMVLGYPEFGVRRRFAADFAPWAQACGGFGARVDKAADLEGVIQAAFAFDGPALVDVMVNPDEPPMPASISYDQAKGFFEAFLRGQPRKGRIATTLFRDKLKELSS